MNKQDTKDSQYIMVKSSRTGRSVFMLADDEDQLQAVFDELGDIGLLCSACLFDAPSLSAACTYPLYFRVASNSVDETRVIALETCYYLVENFGIPENCIDVVFTGGNAGTINKNEGGFESDFTEMLILIPPIVFGGHPSCLMLVLNYDIARHLIRAGLKNIDADIYYKDFAFPLPNSIRGLTGTYVIPLQIRELLYLNAQGIIELSKQPRPENIVARAVPEATKWFTNAHQEAEKEHKRQKQLQKMMLEKGWQIPPCIRQLMWADMDRQAALEACRVISRYLTFVRAAEDEVWFHLLRIDRRNTIQDHERLRAIVTFAVENLWLAKCDHPLLQKHCHVGKCSVATLLDEYEKPYLFENMLAE